MKDKYVKIQSGNYMSLSMYAKSLGISRQAVHKKIQRGKLFPSVKIGNFFLFKV